MYCAGKIFIPSWGALRPDNGKRKCQECGWIIVVILCYMIMDIWQAARDVRFFVACAITAQKDG